MEEYGEVKMKSPVIAWFDNFWYHYKWQSIIALFLVLVVIVCSVQMCSKESYDTYIMYAGHKNILHTSKDGDIPEYNVILSSLKRVSADYDGDGKVTPAFSNLFVMSEEMKQQIQAELKDGETVNEALLSTDKKTLTDRIMYSEYYVCLLSREVYEEYRVISDLPMFAPLAPYTSEGSEYEWAGEDAIYLRSTDFYELAGICDLPEDTVVVLRMKSEMSSVFGGDKNNEMFARAEEVVRNILAE